ncbi:MAG: hypothetical protein HY842_09535, partial [Bacteroidetes bacterium]|nr:hypothetical protein [Bacteroidota bacterium]
MKKLLLGLLAIFVFANITSAQEDPEKALNKAGKALGSYNLDPTNNGEKLKEALQMIDFASAADINKGKVKTWQTKGEIYNAISDKDMFALLTNPDFIPEHPDAPAVAAESFMKALEVATKKYETKDALTGMTESAGKLNTIGNSQIKQQDYAGAFKSLEMVMKIDETTRKNGGEPVIPDV